MAVSQIENTNQDLQYLPFEGRIAELDARIVELRAEMDQGRDVSDEIRRCQKALTEELRRIYANLTPWQVVQVARHPQRPLFRDYLNLMVKNVRELHGDRCFGDDMAIVTAFGQIGREKVMVVGQYKGRELNEKIAANFGCPNPEGYRKALAKMKLAEKFGLPIVTFIDTPGAYPGIGAEERGQAQAIAMNLREMPRLRVPIICIVIGEGGSGGALGIGVGDRLAMLQYAYYSVISPEGCAGILWHDGAKADKAAETLRLTAPELKSLGLIDAIIPESLGGAHRNMHDTIHNVEQYITRTLRDLKRTRIENLLDHRFRRLRAIGGADQRVLPGRYAKPKLPDRVSAEAQLKQAQAAPAPAGLDTSKNTAADTSSAVGAHTDDPESRS